MSAIALYAKLYRKCFRDSLSMIGKNPWTLLLPAAILIARGWAGRLAFPFGIFGGILVMLATAALFSCYLYFLQDLVRGGRVAVSMDQLKTSLGAYLWSVVNVFFVVWIASFV